MSFKTWVKPFAFILFLVLLSLYFLEGLCSTFFVLRGYLAHRKRAGRAQETHDIFHCQHDPELGWVHIPGKRLPDLYGTGRSLTINDQGFRDARDVQERDDPDRFRLVCLGDSFTMGYGVDDQETYPAQLQRLNPKVEAVNMGQGGYSLGQCYLWYRRSGEPLRPDAVVFAFIIADIARLEGGYLKNGYAKPGFAVRQGELLVTHQPVPQRIETGRPLFEKDWLSDILRRESALVRLMAQALGKAAWPIEATGSSDHLLTAVKIFQEMNDSLGAEGVPLVLVLLPEMRHLGIPENRPDHTAVSLYLRRFAERSGIAYLDLFDTFHRSAQDLGVFYLEDQQYHYSPEGNALVARHVDAFLQERLPGYPDRSLTYSSPHTASSVRISFASS